jgi:pilus assembly protein Flp/PilA
MGSLFLSFAHDESGATAIEYGLIAGLIAVVIISTVAVIAKNR